MQYLIIMINKSMSYQQLTNECFLIVLAFTMGCFVSKDKLTKEDMDFLKTHTSYDETTIKEWYKGFKVML